MWSLRLLLTCAQEGSSTVIYSAVAHRSQVSRGARPTRGARNLAHRPPDAERSDHAHAPSVARSERCRDPMFAAPIERPVLFPPRVRCAATRRAAPEAKALFPARPSG